DVGLPNHEAIAAAKGGVAALARSAAATYAPRGLRVNAVAPGLVETPMTQGITGNELALKASVSLHPVGRAGNADEVASLVAWLLGPDSTWVSGQIWGIDGGLGRLKGKAKI
ncbi:MAG: SDR family oxidoreductase, partial [Acidobacteriota bacterium]